MHKIAVLLAAGSLALSACAGTALAEEPVAAPAATRVAKETAGLKTAVFAGGCFWGVEGVFSHVKGVKGAVSGYHGGTQKSAKYDLVSSGVTDHAEAVKITYDPAVIRYDQLLRIFFSVVADPTLKNRQGPDVGAQYRSAIVPMSAEQSAVAKAYLAQLGKAGLWAKPIATKIEPYKAFYAAEAYHQDFMLANPTHGYIRRWDAPKVAALKRMYPGVYRASFLKDAG
ncbi:MAG: peptide-methionine (S)-S-oxide reductase MsrA [Erythrobacter sp.]|uniref:peptide-methionine (S)-S-oxide reductase MsrA n=1 Tax=Erythrobacter sp. TaxID=1042 RepID=UPI0025D25CFF|nr:peptide-methionine (S)-S-oxide reductase MsrA [Erythrobacter sp.]MCL9998736.1 peptide-methionine (S)-S-oxide reductase MsrA [Erythrobacter sp.]